ncbi:MAG TPA: Gfo/Idh/MocA family oxidoreductase, partial [Phycisphaerae bacterium]|nr:Gfo/Idh/MocA family oxidoreductase [Phycisphaerae bacterium]
MTGRKNSSVGRRQLLGTAIAAAGLTFVKSRSVAGTQANSTIELGIIGSGRRGTWIGKLFQKDGRYRIVALADVFDDQLAAARGELSVDAARCHKGMEAYKELLNSKLDAVAIESPPYCHAEQAAAAVEAGKHVYLAKPVATDVPGSRLVMEAGKKAAGRLSFWVDFQSRVTDNFMEAGKRVADGAIGKPFSGQACYYCGAIPYKGDITKKDPETRMRNWIHDTALSGDIIVEQNIHATDVADWYLGGHALKAFGTGGRKVRTEY